MTGQLYEGCWGVTRGGEKRGPMVPNQDAKDPWPFKIVSHSGAFVCAYSKDGIACSHVYPRDLEPHNDIIAVFAAEPEADAYLAGKPAEAPDLSLGDIIRKAKADIELCFARTGGNIAATPKPVTWPDGVESMTTEYDAKVRIVSGKIHIAGGRGFSAADALHFAALLLAAADYVEGRG